MKRANIEEAGGHSSDHCSTHYRNRRQGYYHGKYKREVMTTLLLLVFVGVCLYRIS